MTTNPPTAQAPGTSPAPLVVARLDLERRPRGTCTVCGLRRVLYVMTLHPLQPPGILEAPVVLHGWRCGRCLGVRP